LLLRTSEIQLHVAKFACIHKTLSVVHPPTINQFPSIIQKIPTFSHGTSE
jgi:hypothetical protein